MSAATNVVAGNRPWLPRIFREEIEPLPGAWRYVETQEELEHTLEQLERVGRIYFLHWSSIVPADVVTRYECINFHMTKLPYGRGGSPLQHLIEAGHHDTQLSAIRMTPELDGGPIYMHRTLPLHGSAEAIYARAARLSALMIAEIDRLNPEPRDQEGAPTMFKRRLPEDSAIPEAPDLESLYDFIRMLDARGYPRAFINLGSLRIEFSRAVRYADSVVADVRILEREFYSN